MKKKPDSLDDDESNDAASVDSNEDCDYGS